MTEYWKSEGKQWCKYCRTYVSSNTIQLLQHNTGRKHINNEEAYVREVARKVAKLKEEAERKAKGEDVPAPVECVVVKREAKEEVGEAKAEVGDAKDVEYPAPAHEAYGKWVEVTTETKTEEVAVDDVAASEQQKVEDKEARQETLRIGAENEEDEEEAALRDSSSQGRRANTSTWDTLDAAFRKGRRGGSKRQRRRR